MSSSFKQHGRGRQLGFTLIELMVAILVSAIVLMGVFAFATIQKDTANLQRRQVLLQQALEGSMHAIGTDLRMAGLGFGRQCSEIRIYSQDRGELINPGAVRGDQVGAVVTDPVTQEPYWVLRDGIQAHWNSSAAQDINGNDTDATSATPEAASDSFDIFRGELNMAPGAGLFQITALPNATGGAAVITFESSGLLDNSQNLQLDAVRQMFPPGSFILVAPSREAENYITEFQSQCALLQVTDQVEPGNNGTSWELPVADSVGFNADLETLLGVGGNAVPDDANPGAVSAKTGNEFGADWDPQNFARLDLVPLGRARWSRYEIDYTVATRPMLVRSDIIGWRAGDPTIAAANYPGCPNNACPVAQLYLPGGDADPPRVAIGPMIEDMQVAVGCDGWAPDSGPVLANLVPEPDPGFEEQGPADGPLAGQANRKVDDRAEQDDRGNDEWLGNATEETWGPDCVSWGTAERNKDEWAPTGVGFRMSPQIVRVTLLAKPDNMAAGADAAGDAFYDQLVAIEDRPSMDSAAQGREYKTLTERFRVRNSHWRDPALK